MKKAITVIFFLLLAVPKLTFAHLYESNQFEQEYNIGTRVEVSKDAGTTWVSYDSSDAPALGEGQTLTVSPGDTLTFRVKVWNEGYSNALNVVGVGTKENFNYLTDVSGVFDSPDEDGNSTSITGGSTDTINIGVLAASKSATSGYESATFTGKVKADVPDDTVIKVHYEITSATLPGITFSPSTFWAFIIPKAYADSDGTAVTEARVVVSNPPAKAQVSPPAPAQELPHAGTGADGLYLALGLIAAFYMGRLLRIKVGPSNAK